MERIKMPRGARAKQFMPFDALKGLQEALRLKEYKHESVVLGELSDEQASEISDTLASLERGDFVEAVVYEDGHLKTVTGSIRFKLEFNQIIINEKVINLNTLRNIKKL